MVKSNMISCTPTFILKDEPLKVIKSLFKCMEELSELYHPPKRSYMPGKTYGESKKCELSICRLIAPLISENNL